MANKTKSLIAALKNEYSYKHSHIPERAAEALVQIGTPAVEPLIAALNNRGVNNRGDIRWYAAWALGEIGDPSAVEPLIAALNVGREEAAEALGKIGDHRAVEPLIAALKDKSDFVRCEAAKVLGEMKDPRAVEPLIDSLESASRMVKTEATKALVEIGQPAVEPLIAALKDSNSHVRWCAATVLKEMNWKPLNETERINYLLAEGEFDELIKIGQPVVEPLIDALNVWCAEAIEVLGEIGDPRAVEPLIAVLQGKDKQLMERVIAVNALVKIGNGRAFESLISVLKDEDAYVRKEAAKALGEMKDPRAVEPLIVALNDQDAKVRKEAAKALKRIGQSAVEPLIAALNLGCMEAIKALGEIGDPRAAEPLLAALKDETGDIRWRATAAEALWKIDKMQAFEPLIAALAVEPLIDRLNDSNTWEERKEAAEVLGKLGKIGNPLAIEPLIAALHKPGLDIFAAQALGEIGDPMAIDRLVELFAHTRISVASEDSSDYYCDLRGATAFALMKIGGMRVATKIGDVIDDIMNTPSGYGGRLYGTSLAPHGMQSVVYTAIEILLSLAKKGNPRAVESLVAAFKYSVLSGAVKEALMEIGQPAVEPLIAALNDQDADVRKEAAAALEAVNWEPSNEAERINYLFVAGKFDELIKIGQPAVEPLIAALKDGDVQWRVSKALERIGQPAVEPLIAALNRMDIRYNVAATLWWIDPELLIATLKDSHNNVRRCAVSVLEGMNWEPSDEAERIYCLLAKGKFDKLIKIGQPAVEPLIAALNDQDTDVRKEAACALGKIGDPRAVEPLIAALKDQDADVRKEAAAVLGKMKDPRAVEPLIAALKDNDANVRRCVAEALRYAKLSLYYKIKRKIVSYRANNACKSSFT